jgi:hypothetical protein
VTKENFQSWFVRVLENLYPNSAAGFPIVMIAFPLLERYLRQKVGLKPEQHLNDEFHEKLARLFPPLRDKSVAKEFWAVFRHGLLHQVTFMPQTSKGPLPPGALTHQLAECITVEDDGRFILVPVAFAQSVTQQIEDDFPTFEGAESSAPPLAGESYIRIPPGSIVIASASAPNPAGYILATNTDKL